MALGFEFFPQGLEIFDDAVMHHYQLTAAVTMGVGVGLGRGPMGGPAGMAEAGAAVGEHLVHHLFQIYQFSFAAILMQPPILQKDQSGGIIAAIFKPFQTLKKNGHHPPLPDITDYAAHKIPR